MAQPKADDVLTFDASMRRWIATVCPIAGLVAAFATLAARRLADPDLPWHLSLGRVIASQHSIPRVDPLAFSHRPIQYMEFASDVLLHLVDRAAGPFGLQLFGAAIALTTALCLARTVGTGSTARWGVVGLAMAAMATFLLVRPATISFALLAFTLVLIGAHREAPSSRRGKLALGALVPLVLVWVNVHGFAILGLLVIGTYAAYRSACRFASGRLGAALPSQDASELGTVWAVTLGAFVVSGANLAGYRFLTAPLRAGQDFSRITEWATTTPRFLLDHEPFALAYLLFSVLLLALGREPGGERRVNAFDLALFVWALVLGHSAVRMIPIAAILVTPMVARRLVGFVEQRPVLELGSSALVFLASIAILFSTSSFGVGWEPSQFPESAVRFVQREKPRGQMYNFISYGGYLGYRLYPEQLVFLDGRSGWVHDPVLLDRYFKSESDAGELGALTRDYQLEWAVTRSREGERVLATLATSKKWTMVHFDDVGAVYVRTEGVNSELAVRGYQALNHLTPPGRVLEAAVTGEVPAPALAHDGDLAALQDPESARAAFLSACGAVALRDRAKLERSRARLAQLAPGHPALSVLASAATSAGIP